MKDKTLLKLSLSWSIMGIFILLLLAEFTEPHEIQIKDAEKNIGKTVIIKGNVEKYTAKEKVTFINIRDSTGQLKAVSFDRISKIPKDAGIEITGKIATYKGELEIIIEKLKC